MIDFMISLPNQISAASICSCFLKLVGVAIHKRLLQQINSISFTAFSSRVCQLQFSLCTMCFKCIAVYFPTTWHSEDDVEQVSTLLGFLLDASVKDVCVPVFPVLGGDFNACIRPLANHEALDEIGQWGSGRQNEHGRLLMRFVMAKKYGSIMDVLPHFGQTVECGMILPFLLGWIIAVPIASCSSNVLVPHTFVDNEVWNGGNQLSVLTVCQHGFTIFFTGIRLLAIIIHWRGLSGPSGMLDNKEAIVKTHIYGSGLRRVWKFWGHKGVRHGMPSYVNHFTFTIRKNHKQEVRVWKIERVNAQLGHARNWRTLRSMQFATKGFRQQPTRSQMHLQTCWAKFLQEIQTDRAAQPIWQNTRGQCMNFNVRWVGWKLRRALMRQVWWQNFWKIRLMMSKQTYCVCSMLCYREGQNHFSVFPHFVSKLTFTAKQTRVQHTSLSHSGVDGKRIAVAMFTLYSPNWLE